MMHRRIGKGARQSNLYPLCGVVVLLCGFPQGPSRDRLLERVRPCGSHTKLVPRRYTDKNNPILSGKSEMISLVRH